MEKVHKLNIRSVSHIPQLQGQLVCNYHVHSHGCQLEAFGIHSVQYRVLKERKKFHLDPYLVNRQLLIAIICEVRNHFGFLFAKYLMTE